MLTRNLVDLIGHVGSNPEIRPTRKGGRMASFSLATHDFWLDPESEERHEITQWHRVVVFAAPLVDRVEQWLRKGHKVAVLGSLQYAKWSDGEGHERIRAEVHVRPFGGEITFLERRPDAPPPDANVTASG